MMKMTTNRKLTLLALKAGSVGSWDQPPYSAYSIADTFESAFNYKWIGYEELKNIPSKQQINRTLRDLWRDGLVVGSRVKEESYNGALPHWVIRYQLSSDVEYNHLTAACNALHKKIQKAKYGFHLFGGIFDLGLPTEEVAALSMEVNMLIQKTHPDKVSGLDEQFKQLIECRDMIKSGIPLPVPANSAEKSNLQLSVWVPSKPKWINQPLKSNGV